MASEPSPTAKTARATPEVAATERAGDDVGVAATMRAELAATAAAAMGSGQAAGGAPLLRAGDVAGDYRVIRRIGGGAMGDVYEGEAEAIGKRVAIKVLKNLSASNDEAAERFLREARAVNKINHPNVLDVFAFGKLEDGRLYLVMDLLTGESLGEHIRANGAIAPERFLQIIKPICRALDAAHRAGIVHRDLKPDNVFLADSPDDHDGPHVYVLDFGIAKLLSDAAAEDGQVTLTGEGVWIGTPAYMSPEQWAADPASPQSDVYALGCTAFEMLTGKVPYIAESVPGIMQKHFNEEPPDLDRTVPDGATLPASFTDAIEAALAKEPNDRPESASEFLATLEGTAGKPAAPATTGPVRMIAAGLAVAVLVVAGLVLWSKMGDKKTAEEPGVSASNSAAEADVEGWKLTVITKPAHATVRVDGHASATGRLELSGLQPKQTVTARVSAPGCINEERMFNAEKAGTQTIALSPVRAFEGVWKLHDGALRAFERDGDAVLVFHLDDLDAEPKFLRKFPFEKNQGNWVLFASPVKMSDPRSQHPSCQFELKSEYRYHPGTKRLELRRETAAVKLTMSKRCDVTQRHMLGWEAASRVERASNEVRWAVARGAGRLKGLATQENRLQLGEAGQKRSLETTAKNGDPTSASGDKNSKNVPLLGDKPSAQPKETAAQRKKRLVREERRRQEKERRDRLKKEQDLKKQKERANRDSGKPTNDQNKKPPPNILGNASGDGDGDADQVQQQAVQKKKK